MMTLAITIKGFVFVALMYFIVCPVELFVDKRLPEGRLRKILFYRWEN